MIQQQTDVYIKICMKAWLLCESCIHTEVKNVCPRTELVKDCGDCAKACFAVVSKLVSQPDDLGDLVFDCILHCRQCAATCQEHALDPDIELCGDVCAACGDILKDLPFFCLN